MNNITKKTIQFFITLCLVMGIAALCRAGAMKAQAAGYQCISRYRNVRKPTKNGKYYFKLDYPSRKILMSKEKNSGYQETTMLYRAFGNGKEAYYVDNNVLYKYTYAKREAKKVKTLSASDDEAFSIDAAYGDYIFLTKLSFKRWNYTTYRWNIRTQKLEKVMENCAISERCGKYVVARNVHRNRPYPITLYKITASGLSPVKKLTEYGMDETCIGGKIYYAVYEKGSMKKATLYCVKPNGKDARKIAEITNPYKYGGVIFMGITPKGCVVLIRGELYYYIYSRKKLEKFS